MVLGQLDGFIQKTLTCCIKIDSKCKKIYNERLKTKLLTGSIDLSFHDLVLNNGFLNTVQKLDMAAKKPNK